MLVTFRSKAHPNITMFGDIAVKLLKLMGHSGTVPSALLASDIPAAVARLRAAIAEQHPVAPPPKPQDDEAAEPAVSLPARALPLIQLLEAAAADGADVMWDS